MEEAVPGEFAFEAEVIYWRGPAPFFFAPMPSEPAAQIKRIAGAVTYGWGAIPVDATLKGVAFKTALIPKDGGYLLPLKVAVRRKTSITAGDRIAVEMSVDYDRWR
jgi:hypothetical protein